MQRRQFGPLRTQVPVIGIGTWNFERDDPKQAIAALRRALDLGMVHVDTAELYGDGKVELLVGEAIAGYRDQVFLASKVLPKHGGAMACRRACEASLRRLGTDHLDLYLLHWRGDTPLEETLRAFEALREAGKIRAWGVSNFDDAELDEVERLVPGQVACNQILYHLTERTMEHRVLPWCAQRGVAVVAYSPFGSSGGFPASPALDAIAARLGATPRQVALAYLIRNPAVFAIPKTARVEHVDEIADTDRVALDAEAIAAIEASFPLAPWTGLATV